MIIATHGIIASQLAGFDADAQAFFDRVTTAGGSLSNTEKTAVNKLVLDMKSYSIWSKMKAIYPMVGASSAACAQNLKSSSFTGTFNGGITYASTGITGNGTTGFMNTSFIPSTNLSTSSGHWSFYCRTNSANAGIYEIGSSQTSSSGPYNALIIKFSNSNFYAAYGDYSLTYNNANSQGFYIVNRNSSTITTGFKNNTKVINSSQTATLSNIAFYILAENVANISASHSNRECAFATFGNGLSDTEASNFYTAVQAFQTTLARQV
jgi:hypothetical protein